MSVSPSTQASADPEAVAKILRLSHSVSTGVHEVLVELLKPECRALMAAGYEKYGHFSGVSMTHLEEFAKQFDDPLISPELLAEVARALVQDGEWLGTDKRSGHRHHRWTPNPHYSAGSVIHVPAAADSRPETWAKKLESNMGVGAWLRERLIQDLKPWMRKQMATAGTINYWELAKLADHFEGGKISHDVLVSAAESLVDDGEWVNYHTEEQGHHWRASAGNGHRHSGGVNTY